MNTCPNCQATSKQVKAGRTKAGSQRIKCGHCQRRYTPEAKEHGYPQALREQAVKLYLEAGNYRRIGRLLGVDHKTVILWVNAYVDQLPEAPLPKRVAVAEQDELFTFIEKKKTSPMS
jgi:transposase-like protein